MFLALRTARERCDTSFFKLCCKIRRCSQGTRSSGGGGGGGGRLPDRLWAGALDDDAAHFEKIVLAMPEPSRLLPVHEEARAA